MSTEESLKQKNIYIDTLRGLACIFLVFYHIIGSGLEKGLKIDSGLLRDFNDLLAYVRMPLFTFLSGYVYAIRPFKDGVGRFINGKLRRLILPMLVVGTFFAVIQSITPGSNDTVGNWTLLHIIPVAHFWFVEALFIIFMFVLILEKLRCFNTQKHTLAVLLVSFILFLLPLNTNLFAGSGALYLLPFFLTGMYIKRFNVSGSKLVGAWLTLLVCLALLWKYPNFYISKHDRDIFTLIIGLASCIALYFLRFKNFWLASIGRYSYAIYIYHVFFTAACRICLHKLGIYDLGVVISISLCVGLTGPVILELILNKNAYARTIFLGKRLVRPSSVNKAYLN